MHPRSPKGVGPQMPYLLRLNHKPRPATALSDPCASAQGHTLPDRSRRQHKKVPNAMQNTVTAAIPSAGNPR